MKKIIERIKADFPDDPEETLNTLLDLVDKQSAKYDDFLMLKARYNLIARQSNQGVISREDFKVEQNLINSAFLAFLNDVNDEDLASKATQKWDLFSFKYELAAFEEIEEEIQKSQSIKLHCIRGSKLFKEGEGLFDLLKYDSQGIKPSKLLNFKVLLLDYDSLNNDEYQNLKQSITINWRGLQNDRNKLAQTINRVKLINEKYKCKVRLYNVNMFQHIKLFIFEDNCYFTFYHKLGRVKKHQEYPLFKVSSSSPLYDILENIFDTTWQNSNTIMDEKT